MNENTWKEFPITKNPDGTFNITHAGSTGIHPYNVCPKDIDPAGVYDVDEVAAFWDSLLAGDPRKLMAAVTEAEGEPEDGANQ